MEGQGSLRKLSIPTELPIGTVNAYLLMGEEPALIDTGPNCDYSFDFLKKEIKRNGLDMSDIGKVLLTHGHVDHYGLATKISERSKARIFAHEGDKEMVENLVGVFRQNRDRVREEMRKNGMPQETLNIVEDFFEFLLDLSEETRVDHCLHDGQEIGAGDTILKVIHTPGHSLGSVSFLSSQGDLFTGDALLAGMTPNSVCGDYNKLAARIPEYVETLRKLRIIDTKQIFPGHGESFTDARSVADRCLAMIDSRRNQILETLSTRSLTAFDLTTMLYGMLPIQEIFLGFSEVLGHLEALREEGRIVRREREAVVTYEV